MKSSVFFGVEGKRVETRYDRDQLKLGAAVYVRFSDTQEAVGFSPQRSEGSIEYRVTWISPSEWYVALVGKFDLRPRFAERVQEEVGEYISRPEIDAALARFVSGVRMDRFYQTDELGGNPLSVIFTVLERLVDCRRLRKSSPYPKEIAPYLDDPMVSYLYLTCFDRLGQPAKFLDFGSWMESRDCEPERNTVLRQAARSGNLEDGIRTAHRHYNVLYGVKSAFFRFLGEVLPPEARRELLDSIDRDVCTYPPNSTARKATEQEKEKYLFQRRNDYTHKGISGRPQASGSVEVLAVQFKSFGLLAGLARKHMAGQISSKNQCALDLHAIS